MTLPPIPSSPDHTTLLTRLRSRARFLLSQAWFLNTLLFLLIGFQVTRTLTTKQTAEERDQSAMLTQTLEAMDATKQAFDADDILKPTPIVQAKSPTPAIKTASGKLAHAPFGAASRTPTGKRLHPAPTDVTPAISEDLRQREQERAIAGWRKLAQSKIGKAAEWRRLGLTLFLFHRPGGLDAFRHIASLPPPVTPKTSKAHPLRNVLTDPFGHRPSRLAPAQEVQTWETIFGDKPPTPAQVPALRDQVRQLRLGWFENVALGMLYQRAGLKAEARTSAQQAARAAAPLTTLNTLTISGFLLGTLLLFVVVLVWAVNALARRMPPAAPAYAPPPYPPAGYVPPYPSPYYAGGSMPGQPVYVPPYGLPPPPPPPSPYGQSPYGTGIPAYAAPLPFDYAFVAPQAANAPPDLNSLPVAKGFPYPVLLLAFLLYMLTHEYIGLPVGWLVGFLHLNDWSPSARLRLALALQIGLYPLVVAAPLWLIGRYRRANGVAPGTSPGLRGTLADMGFRTRNPLLEVGAGWTGYLVSLPLLLIAGLISNRLFHNVTTPLNPVDFETLATQSLIDRLLVLSVASVCAPIIEEMTFRGLLYPALRQKLGVWGGAALSAAIFSGVHPTLPGGFLTIWAIGFVLALLYEKRGSLYPGILSHGLNNALITLMQFATFAQ